MAEVINMPRLSDTMEEGTVAKWLFKIGDNKRLASGGSNSFIASYADEVGFDNRIPLWLFGFLY